MIPFLLLLGSAACFLLVLFHAVTGINLTELGLFLLALGVALGAYPGPWSR